MIARLVIPTIEGNFVAHYSQHGLARLEFPHAKTSGTKDVPTSPADSPQISRWHRLTTDALNDSLAGRAPREMPPLDLSVGTDFQRRVWGALCRIASGRSQSYAEVAVEIGNPRATRAVGGACGANPIPVLVPCHRVLAAHRAIGGFTSGLGWKRKLLAREGISIS
jgi:methylated-DNA-[protein]-cysteine S-methyltransferase